MTIRGHLCWRKDFFLSVGPETSIHCVERRKSHFYGVNTSQMTCDIGKVMMEIAKVQFSLSVNH